MSKRLGVMRAFSEKPPGVLLATALMSTPIILAVVVQHSIPVIIGLIPSMFVIWRVYSRDNVARWVASLLLVMVIGTGIQGVVSTQSMHDTNTVSVIDGIEPVPDRGFGWMFYLSLGCFAGGLVLLHLPPARRWFAGTNRDGI